MRAWISNEPPPPTVSSNGIGRNGRWSTRKDGMVMRACMLNAPPAPRFHPTGSAGTDGGQLAITVLAESRSCSPDDDTACAGDDSVALGCRRGISGCGHQVDRKGRWHAPSRLLGTAPLHRSCGLLLEPTRGVTIAVVSSRERKRRQPGLATDDPAFVGWHQLVRGIQGSQVHFDFVCAA